MSEADSIIGKRVPRLEDRRLLTTGGVYVDDVVDDALTGSVRVGFVRSPIAHARIEAIDLSAARAATGCIAAFSAADVGADPLAPISPKINSAMRRPLLAENVVRYVGEPVAMVITESAYDVEDVAELVDVSYDPLPVVVDPRAAARDEQLLFPESGSNTACTFGPETLDRHLFDGCEVVISREIVNQRVAPAPLETRAVAAAWGPDGRLTAWVSNQGAQWTQRALAQMLDVDPSVIRVITPDVGGAFGAKSRPDPEIALVAWAARRLNCPARWVGNRYENLQAMTHGRAQLQTVTLGGTRDGTIEAYRLEVIQDCGAYPVFGALLPAHTGLMAPGTYRIPRVEFSACSIVTNTTPVAAYRGAGRPEATAAIERALDLFAAEIGMDPAQVRRRNLLPAFTEPYQNGCGATYDCGDYPSAFARVLATGGYEELRREQDQRRVRGDTALLGIGLTCYVEVTGMSANDQLSENAMVEVHPDGSATVLTGTSPQGQGHVTAWAMLAHEVLGVPIEKIDVRYGDTDLIPEGTGTRGSRSLQLGGSAVLQASREVRDLAKSRAAVVLEANVDDLYLDTRLAAISVKGAPHISIALAELAARERLCARTVFVSPGATYPFGAYLAVVEVDRETGKVRLLRVVSVDDAGTILNPLLADGQLHGGIAQGASQALFEEVVYDEDGNPLTSSFADYAFPSAYEMPSFELEIMETPTANNPLGAKGIGESGAIGAAPAVQNAVIDAVAHLGVRHIDMPATSWRVWRAINDARSDSEG